MPMAGPPSGGIPIAGPPSGGIPLGGPPPTQVVPPVQVVPPPEPAAAPAAALPSQGPPAQTIDSLRTRLAGLGVPESSFRIGRPTGRAWTMEQTDEGWRVGWYDRAFVAPAMFEDVADASAFLLGKLMMDAQGGTPGPVHVVLAQHPMGGRQPEMGASLSSDEPVSPSQELEVPHSAPNSQPPQPDYAPPGGYDLSKGFGPAPDDVGPGAPDDAFGPGAPDSFGPGAPDSFGPGAPDGFGPGAAPDGFGPGAPPPAREGFGPGMPSPERGFSAPDGGYGPPAGGFGPGAYTPEPPAAPDYGPPPVGPLPEPESGRHGRHGLPDVEANGHADNGRPDLGQPPFEPDGGFGGGPDSPGFLRADPHAGQRGPELERTEFARPDALLDSPPAGFERPDLASPRAGFDRPDLARPDSPRPGFARPDSPRPRPDSPHAGSPHAGEATTVAQPPPSRPAAAPVSGDWPISPLPGEPPLTLFRGKRLVELEPGTEIDRFGDDEGNLVYAFGTPFKERSLVPEWVDRPYRVYQVRQPVQVLTGAAIPWFDQPGGGTAYLLPDAIGELVAMGRLVEVDGRDRPPA
jgi:hypothetical protein